MKARKELVFELECVPAFVPVMMLLILLAPALSSVLSSTHSLCLQTARTATESMAMVVSLPPAVAVAVNPATQTSEPIVVVPPDAPSQMIYCSLALVTPPAL